MKKILLLSILASSLFAFDECHYYTEQTLKFFKEYGKAINLKLYSESRTAFKMMERNNNKVLIKCDKESVFYKDVGLLLKKQIIDPNKDMFK